MTDEREWVLLMEGVRIIARRLSGSATDRFSREVLSQAAGLLEVAGRTGKLRAEGIRYLDYHRTPLLKEDWQLLRVHADSRLDDPHRNISHFRVRIVKVVVDAADVRALIGALATSADEAEQMRAGDVATIERSRGAQALIKDREEIRAHIAGWVQSRAQGSTRLGAKKAREEIEAQTGESFAVKEFEKVYPQVCGTADRGRPRKIK